MMRTRWTAGWALVALLAAPLAAQDAPGGKTKATADVGFVNVAGNTEVTTLNVGERLEHTAGAWTVAQSFGVVYGRTDGATSASSWKADLRADRALSKLLAVFAMAGWDRNRFAGIDRRFQEAVGLAVTLVKSERNLLEAEAGAAFTQQRNTSGVDNNFTAARAAARYRRTLSPAAYVQQSLEALPNLEDSRDLRLHSETSLVAPLSARIALKASYAIRYDRQPEPGFQTTDRILTTGLQIVF